MNRITIDGTLGKNAEELVTSSGMSVTKFSVASNYKAKDKEPTTTWFNIVCFGDVAKGASSLLKGDRVFVEGRYEEQSYQKKDGTSGKSSSVIANGVYLSVSMKARKQQVTEFGDAAPFVSGKSDTGFDDIPF